MGSYVVFWLCNHIVKLIVNNNGLIILCYSNRSTEHVPDIIWCREPFMKSLNEIKDIDN